MTYEVGGLTVREVYVHLQVIHSVAGANDDGGPLRKVAACAVIANPYAGQGFVTDLSRLVDGSLALATMLGAEAMRALGEPAQSYGKAGLAGTSGEQEHITAALTSVFGDAFRSAIGGAKAWIASATKVAATGSVIDVPLAYKDEVWVRSHYDAIEVRVPGAPLPDELVVIAAVANRGRINARLGGLSVAEAQARAGAAG
jgi:Amino acid synthesis